MDIGSNIDFEYVGDGPCVDSDQNRPSYCNPTEENYSSVEDCQNLCASYPGCQAIYYQDTWGSQCRVYFNSYEEAQAMLPLTYGSWDCHHDYGMNVISGDGSTGQCFIASILSFEKNFGEGSTDSTTGESCLFTQGVKSSPTAFLSFENLTGYSILTERQLCGTLSC